MKIAKECSAIWRGICLSEDKFKCGLMMMIMKPIFESVTHKTVDTISLNLSVGDNKVGCMCELWKVPVTGARYKDQFGLPKCMYER